MFLLALLPGCSGQDSESERETSLTVFAAASLRNVLMEFHDQAFPNTVITMQLAGSNTLAEQILANPVAHVFVSADLRQMDRLVDAGRVQEVSIRTLASNDLGVIAHSDHPIILESPQELLTLDYTALAIGLPDAVPAGIYARQWLSTVLVGKETLWDSLQDRILPMRSVRAVLAAVASEPTLIGIVYTTDLAVSDQVQMIYAVPESEEPNIAYVAAPISRNQPHSLAEAYLDELVGDTGSRIFADHGFEQVDGDNPSAP
jgi:molybdate transport system substrate-binding protein